MMPTAPGANSTRHRTITIFLKDYNSGEYACNHSLFLGRRLYA